MKLSDIKKINFRKLGASKDTSYLDEEIRDISAKKEFSNVDYQDQYDMEDEDMARSKQAKSMKQNRNNYDDGANLKNNPKSIRLKNIRNRNENSYDEINFDEIDNLKSSVVLTNSDEINIRKIQREVERAFLNSRVAGLSNNKRSANHKNHMYDDRDDRYDNRKNIHPKLLEQIEENAGRSKKLMHMLDDNHYDNDYNDYEDDRYEDDADNHYDNDYQLDDFDDYKQNLNPLERKIVSVVMPRVEHLVENMVEVWAEDRLNKLIVDIIREELPRLSFAPSKHMQYGADEQGDKIANRYGVDFPKQYVNSDYISKILGSLNDKNEDNIGNYAKQSYDSPQKLYGRSYADKASNHVAQPVVNNNGNQGRNGGYEKTSYQSVFANQTSMNQGNMNQGNIKQNNAGYNNSYSNPGYSGFYGNGVGSNFNQNPNQNQNPNSGYDNMGNGYYINNNYQSGLRLNQNQPQHQNGYNNNGYNGTNNNGYNNDVVANYLNGRNFK